MSDKTARERFVEAMQHLNGNPRTWKADVCDAFADAECIVHLDSHDHEAFCRRPIRKAVFGEDDAS